MLSYIKTLMHPDNAFQKNYSPGNKKRENSTHYEESVIARFSAFVCPLLGC